MIGKCAKHFNNKLWYHLNNRFKDIQVSIIANLTNGSYLNLYRILHINYMCFLWKWKKCPSNYTFQFVFSFKKLNNTYTCFHYLHLMAFFSLFWQKIIKSWHCPKFSTIIPFYQINHQTMPHFKEGVASCMFHGYTFNALGKSIMG